METLILPIATQLLAVFLLFIYFSKKRLNTKETKVYSKMLIINFLYALMAIITFIYAKTYGNNMIIAIMQKIYMSLMLLLIINILIYNISIVNMKSNLKKVFAILIKCFSVILFIFVFITPLNVINKGNILDGNGLSYDIVLFATAIYFILIIISAIVIFIKNKSGFTKDMPFVCLIILYVVGLVIRNYYPSIMFENFLFTFMLFIMYFTIENPDLKMVNELLRNKELVEKQMEDKSRFLFEVTEDIKGPAKNILMLSDTFYKLNEKDQKDAIKIIRSNANGVLFKINNVLNISSMDASKIKVFNNEYNIYNLFEVVEGIAKNLNKNENVVLKFDINSNIPTILYGDDVRLKQILVSVLTNSINNTKTGFINVSLSAIVRYDVARLIINIEDTGCGMSIDKINTILDDNRELSMKEVVKLDKLDMDLVATIKSIKLLGGSFNIKSEENKGSTFTIVIDQKCDIKEKTDIMKDIEKYSSDVFGRKRVLIVDDDKEELFKISDILSKYNVDINTTMSGEDCIYKIKSGEIYNLIIIDDELKNESALGTLQELKKNKKFNSKVIVMLGDEKKYLKGHYIEDGFTDVIIKENIKDELKEKIESNL